MVDNAKSHADRGGRVQQADAEDGHATVRRLHQEPSLSVQLADVDDEDDGVVQRDVDERFSRYRETIGEGRFKVVYRGFDERNGLDIAWGIISGDRLGLDHPVMQQLLAETQRNTKLRHKNIIKCFKCWPSDNQINLVTELFTSGNLRDFTKEHKQLGADALRKFSKQIREGIEYLHAQDPPVVHGDLRCDKIYVNGNEGTVKIGDLGLVTLLARRYATSEPGSAYGELASHADSIRQSPDYDVYSFGMCMLEMYTQVRSKLHNVPSS
jgi:WNK lysine deficient protein kinase